MLNTTPHEAPAIFISGDKDGRRIEFAADADAFAKLVAALEYFFDNGGQTGGHFHLDADACGSLLHPAAPALVFVCL